MLATSTKTATFLLTQDPCSCAPTIVRTRSWARLARHVARHPGRCGRRRASVGDVAGRVWHVRRPPVRTCDLHADGNPRGHVLDPEMRGPPGISPSETVADRVTVQPVRLPRSRPSAPHRVVAGSFGPSTALARGARDVLHSRRR